MSVPETQFSWSDATLPGAPGLHRHFCEAGQFFFFFFFFTRPSSIPIFSLAIVPYLSLKPNSDDVPLSVSSWLS